MPEDDARRVERFEAGKQVFEAVTGGAATGVVAGLADIAPEFAHQIVAWGFGEIYSRPALAPEQRQLLTLGILTSLGGCEAQLEVHIGVALNVGLTPEQIIEAFLHAAVYSGFPRALNAVAVARKVFTARGLMPLH